MTASNPKPRPWTLPALFLLLAAFGIEAPEAAAQTINICDRTAQVRDRILREMSLSECTTVPSDRLASVRLLNLHGNRLRNEGITALKAGDFDNLPALISLELGSNPLTVLPSGIFGGLTGLEWLYLEGNRLTALPSGIFAKLPALETLELSRNRLAALPGGIFDNLVKLEALDLSINLLDGLTADHPLFSNLPALDRLRLDNNGRPPSPPDCQPNGGFPSCLETEPEPPEPGDPEPPAPGEPEPPAPGDLAARLAEAEAAIEALRDAIKIATAERQRADAAHGELLDDHAGRLDAIEENMPPRRLRLWVPAQDDGELVKTPADG